MLLVAGCAPGDVVPTADDRDPAVLLVTIDTLRADRLGCGGDPRARTPHLDRLARTGLQYAVAIAAVPVTLPSHATILTGLVPPEHGVRDNGLYRVPDDVPSVAEAFRAAGWNTAAFVAAYPLAARFGLDRGFARYHDEFGVRDVASGAPFAERPADRVNESVAAWTASAPDGPAFLWVHYFDPHAPYAPPRPWGVAPRDPYRGEVSFTDRQLGAMLQGLRERYDVRLSIVTADHGESLGEHRESTHGIFIYEATTRVPLLLAGPDVPATGLRPGPVPLTAVAPTLAEGAGLDASTFPDPPLAGGDEAADDLYTESMYPRLRHGWSELRAFRTRDWKVIQAPRPEAYDLRTDPGETMNLWENDDLPAFVDELFDRLEDEAFAFVSPSAAPDPEVEARLASLGYASVAEDDGDRPDPKDRVLVERSLGRAAGLLEAGNLVGARASLAAVRQRDPHNKEAQLLLARVEASSGNVDRARALLDEALRLPPPTLDSTVHYEMGRLALDRGEPLEAERHFETSVMLDPLHVDARYNWGLAAYRDGRFGDAAERWREVLRLDPNHANAKQWLGDAEQRAAGEAP